MAAWPTADPPSPTGWHSSLQVDTLLLLSHLVPRQACGALGLNSECFRYMEWDGEGNASIEEAPVEEFWQVACGNDPMIGTFNCCLVDLKDGAAI